MQNAMTDSPIFEIKPLGLPVGSAKQHVADSGALCWGASASVADSGILCWQYGTDMDAPDA
jgi:hypothetical protein